MERLRINATIGVNEGFFHSNQKNTKNIPKLVQQLCEEEYQLSGVYVSFIYEPSIAIYLTRNGCPDGGEYTFNLQTIATPQVLDLDKWKESVLRIIRKLKELLKQATVYVEYSKCEVDYWEN